MDARGREEIHCRPQQVNNRKAELYSTISALRGSAFLCPFQYRRCNSGGGTKSDYHVGCGAFAIYAGTLNSRNKNLWQNKTECTDEAICAVRDYIVQECLGGLNCEKATSGGYEWTLKDGRVVELRVTVKDGGKQANG